MKQILVVDDEPMLRSLVGRMLTDAGYSVLEAADGGEALHVLERFGRDLALVISDVVMPKVNGIELLERLSLSHRGLPVVLMSGYRERELLAQGLAAPCAMLEKPFSSAALLAEVRRCLVGAA